MRLTTSIRNLFVFFLVSGYFFSSALLQPSIANASSPDVDITKEELADYRLATEDCSTPSLECLVKNVSRFTAIEWVQDIVGKDNKICIEDGSCTSSTGAGSTIADYGAIGSLSNLIVAMYDNPVADTQSYVADVLKSAHIVTPAYAQGLGFASLDPVLNLWKTFRNIAYMFFVLIFVIVGFLIMFRQKMGQTAITAQQAIPQIIMSLVLVTFSYAIAGLLIDLMYVLMALIVGVFASFFPQDIFGYNIFELGGTMFKGAVNLQRNKDFISGFLESLNLGGTANQVVSIISGLTLTIILAVAMLIGIIRLFFELLKSYATIIIAVVMAPLLLMMGAIPGKSNAFGSWIKTLIGNLSPFPVILVVLVMYYAFTNGAINASSGGFMPPFLLSAGNGIGESIIALMSLAIILALPDIVKKIKDGIAPKDAFAELVVGSAMSNAKQGLPLGGRLGLGTSGAALGAGGGALAGGAQGFGRSAWNIMRNPSAVRSNPKMLLNPIRQGLSGAALGNEHRWIDDEGNEHVEMRGGALRGARTGARLGIRATANIAKSYGANQPDILNPATNLIDRIDPKLAEKQKQRQEFEDRGDLLAEILRRGQKK